MIDLRFIDRNGELIQAIYMRVEDADKWLQGLLARDKSYVVTVREPGVETDDVHAIVDERNDWRRRAIAAGYDPTEHGL